MRRLPMAPTVLIVLCAGFQCLAFAQTATRQPAATSPRPTLVDQNSKITIDVIDGIGSLGFPRLLTDEMTDKLLTESIDRLAQAYQISNRPEALKKKMSEMVAQRVDAWGTPFKISIDSATRSGHVESAGQDKAFGTADDLVCDWIGHRGWDTEYEKILWNYAQRWKVPPALKAAVAENSKPVWAIVSTWEGTGSKQTETFQVSSKEWRIHWVSQGDGNFAVNIYNEAGRPVDLVANVIGAGHDISYMHGGPGRYYLKVLGSGSWVVAVEDQRR